MSNVFKKFMNAGKKPNRYAFDLSFNNNFTTQFGRLTPVFCQEVNPGDSVRINPTFGLNFAPFLYPVQTKIKAHLHFFYVRNRSLWKDWMDFIGNTKDDLIPPFMDFSLNKHLLKDGSLADYFGLPTSYLKSTGSQTVILPCENRWITENFGGLGDFWQYAAPTGELNNVFIPEIDKTVNESAYPYTEYFYKEQVDSIIYDNPVLAELHTFTATQVEPNLIGDYSKLYSNNIKVVSTGQEECLGRCRVIALVVHDIITTAPNVKEVHYKDSLYINQDINFLGGRTPASLELTSEQANTLASWRYFTENDGYTDAPDRRISIVLDIRDGSVGLPVDGFNVEIEFADTNLSDLVSAEDNRFYTSDLQKISSLPFRAYDAIYNSFYRNPQNNPLIIDGKPEYNKYVREDTGGRDTTVYNFYNRNWDDDVFTTAVQSPQQGYAPLVGVTSYGLMTFQDDNGTYTAQANVADDGDTIQSISIKSPDMPTTTARALVDMVSSGISISDFRNVNALQRWLEKNMRRGLRYRDQMLTHFGSEVSYDELLMPEFIGGMSQSIDVNRVINQTGSSESPLGAFAGLAQAFGGTNNNITHYADEHGFIIGILSVVPYAVYSQTLPRMFTRFSTLDYFFPEFNHVGMQPVYNKDLCPLQVADAYSESSDEEIKKMLNGTFGYNRPYWDYISKLDEAHGNFRNNYRDYLLHRVFKGLPYLSPDFLTINESDLNDVFATLPDAELEYSDKILGLIHFDYTKKTTVSEFAQPRLEN